jgi:hypothetical protein
MKDQTATEIKNTAQRYLNTERFETQRFAAGIGEDVTLEQLSSIDRIYYAAAKAEVWETIINMADKGKDGAAIAAKMQDAINNHVARLGRSTSATSDLADRKLLEAIQAIYSLHFS